MSDKMAAEKALMKELQNWRAERPDEWKMDEIIRLAEKALSAPRVPDGWSPIETAPVDGTAVLVMCDIWPGTASGRAEQCVGHNTYVAEWWAGEEGGNGKWVCYMDAALDPVCPIEPTHWMPLPHPPSLLAASPEPAHPEVVGITVASADSEPQDPLVKRAMLMVDAIDRDATIADLRAEVEALKALELALAEFEAETEALPLGHESKSNGASTYNWRTRMVAELREKAARLREGGE